MVSITACWKKLPDLCLALIVGFWLLACGSASAAEIEISSAQLTAVDDGYAVSADFSFELSARLEEAVAKGVVLPFVVEFEISRPRWYWFDEKLQNRQMHIRLSYHALTRQYRVSTGGLHQSFSSLSEALRVLSRIRNWLVIDRGLAEKLGLRAGEPYQATLRMKLDISQLPKPFQIVAVGSRDWILSSEWKTWPLTLPAGEPR